MAPRPHFVGKEIELQKKGTCVNSRREFMGWWNAKSAINSPVSSKGQRRVRMELVVERHLFGGRYVLGIVAVSLTCRAKPGAGGGDDSRKRKE